MLEDTRAVESGRALRSLKERVRLSRRLRMTTAAAPARVRPLREKRPSRCAEARNRDGDSPGPGVPVLEAVGPDGGVEAFDK